MKALAGEFINAVSALKATPAAQKALASGGEDLLRASVPGALITAGLGTITTGNPLAGLAIGAADLGLSFGGTPISPQSAPGRTNP